MILEGLQNFGGGLNTPNLPPRYSTGGWIPRYYVLIIDVKYVTPGFSRRAISCTIYFKFHRQPPCNVSLWWIQRYPQLPLLGPSYKRPGLQRFAGGHRRGPRGLCDSIAYGRSQSNRLWSHSGTVAAGCRCYGSMSLVSFSQCCMADTYSASETEHTTKCTAQSSHIFRKYHCIKHEIIVTKEWDKVFIAIWVWKVHSALPKLHTMLSPPSPFPSSAQLAANPPPLSFNEWKTNLMSLSILFHFLCAQNVLDINVSFIRSLRLCCWITKSVVLCSVAAGFEWCSFRRLQPATCTPLKSSRTKSPTHNELRTRRPMW